MRYTISIHVIRSRLQLIQKPTTNAVPPSRSKQGFKTLASICTSLMPDSFWAKSISWARLSALRSPSLTGGTSGTKRVAAEGCSSASPRDAEGNSDWSRTDLHSTSNLFIQLRQPETLHRNCSHLLSSQPEEEWMSLVLIPMALPAKMTIILIYVGESSRHVSYVFLYTSLKILTPQGLSALSQGFRFHIHDL